MLSTRLRARAAWFNSLACIAMLGFARPAFAVDEPDRTEPVFGGTTLEDYLHRAIEANPDLRAFEDRYRAAMERVPQVSALPDPMFEATHFVEAMRTAMGTQNQEVMLSQQVPWFGKLDSRRAVASPEAEALRFAFQGRQLELARNVATAYYEYAYTARALEFAAENLRLLQELEPNVEERVRGGGDLNPLLRIKVEIGRVRDQVQSLEEGRRAQSARLAGMLALPTEMVLPFPDWEAPEAAQVASTELVRGLEENNPELSMLDRRIASAEASRQLSRLEGRPDVTVGVKYMIMGDAMPGDRDPWGVTVGLNIPLWQGKYRAMRREALSIRNATELERSDRLNMLRAELSASLAELRDAHRRLVLFDSDLLPLARQALDISRSSYEGGRATILEVIDSERSLLDLQLQYWRAAADAWQHRVTIQALTNQPLAGTFVPGNER